MDSGAIGAEYTGEAQEGVNGIGVGVKFEENRELHSDFCITFIVTLGSKQAPKKSLSLKVTDREEAQILANSADSEVGHFIRARDRQEDAYYC